MVPRTYTSPGTPTSDPSEGTDALDWSGPPRRLEPSRSVMSSPKMEETFPRLISSMMNALLPWGRPSSIASVDRGDPPLASTCDWSPG